MSIKPPRIKRDFPIAKDQTSSSNEKRSSFFFTKLLRSELSLKDLVVFAEILKPKF